MLLDQMRDRGRGVVSRETGSGRPSAWWSELAILICASSKMWLWLSTGTPPLLCCCLAEESGERVSADVIAEEVERNSEVTSAE